MRETMRTIGGVVRAVSLPMALVTGAFVPTVVHGATGEPASRLVDVPAEQRLRLDVDLPALGDGDTEGRVATGGGRVPRGAMVYRFLISATDTTGAAVAGDTPWEATIFVGARSRDFRPLRPLTSLGSGMRDVTMPRPLGYRLEEGDSLVFVAARRPGSTGEAIRLNLVIEYERAETVTNRLAVTPLPAPGVAQPMEQGGVAIGSAVLQWEWAPEVDGRILAIAGLPLGGASELALEDVTSGERVWGVTLRDAQGRSVFGNPGQVVRLGAEVKAGRVYRLSVTMWETTRAASGGMAAADALVAMVLPVAGNGTAGR